MKENEIAKILIDLAEVKDVENQDLETLSNDIGVLHLVNKDLFSLLETIAINNAAA